MSGIPMGKHSFSFTDFPVIRFWASVAGKKESEGPLKEYYDITSGDPYWGEKTWESAEKHMQQTALCTLLDKAGLQNEDIGLIFSGDLLNQCIGSSFAIRNTGVSHLGLYGACSTMAESLLGASMAVGGGFSDRVIAMTSSHFASSERQYRFPLGYGGQRTPTSQWTVTGSGAALVTKSGQGPKITGCTVGTVFDLGIKDACNMGCAMAPAAFETIKSHMEDFHTKPEDYDLIATGDLGKLGQEALLKLAEAEGMSLKQNLVDCGTLVYDLKKQAVSAGGSGCGCSAIALCGYLLDLMQSHKYNKILFCGTGALLSPTSTQQGLPISGICHAVRIEGGK